MTRRRWGRMVAAAGLSSLTLVALAAAASGDDSGGGSAASGLLSRKIGGPSVFPFQHDGILLNRATPAA